MYVFKPVTLRLSRVWTSKQTNSTSGPIQFGNMEPKEVDEEVALNTNTAEEADAQRDSTCSEVIVSCGRNVQSCFKDEDHRKLAICSIFCGVSCLGIVALISSVKVRTARKAGDLETERRHSQRAKKYAVMSIVVLVLILVSTPILLGLISYLLTFID